MVPESSPSPCAPAEALPEGMTAYRRTPAFTEITIPNGLLRAHSTKAGTWGLIHVLEGALVYRVLDDRRTAVERRLEPGAAPGVVEPEILHEVAPQGSVLFYVEFFRSGAEAEVGQMVG